MDAVKPGVSEFDISAEANYAMFKAGSEHPALAITVAAGLAPVSNTLRPPIIRSKRATSSMSI
jgi:hypothetical protein